MNQNHWKPSRLAVPQMVDPLEAAEAFQGATLRPQNVSRRSVGSIDRANADYETPAESATALAPFLQRNMQEDYDRDLQGRSYIVLQGGDTFYYEPDDVAKRQYMPLPGRFSLVAERDGDGFRDVKEDVAQSRDKVSFPDRRDVYGHHGKGELGNIRNRGGFP